MIRAFTPGDSFLIRRLQRQGLSLDLCRVLTEPASPLREAWLAFVTGRLRGQITLVWRNVSGPEGVIQVQMGADQTSAQVTYLAPRPEGREAIAVWARLLEAACANVGERGASRLFAQAASDGTVTEVLRQLGFSPYASQTVFQLAGGTEDDPPPDAGEIRPWRSSDQWAAQRLCAAITPRPVRQAEGPEAAWIGMPPAPERLVLLRREELAGVLCVHSGRLGIWFRVLVRPEAPDGAVALLKAGLASLRPGRGQSVFCAVRTYESYLWQPLLDLGFEELTEQALMVRQMAVRAQAAVGEPVVALKQGAEPATPTLTHATGEAEQ